LTLDTIRYVRLDFRRQSDVEAFLKRERPEYVFVAAARVGGIYANNTYPAEFIYDNLVIQTSIIHSAYQCGVKKLLFLGSSCIYPKFAPQPMKEEYLLTGELEPTNEPYAIAKIAGIKMCQAYNRQYGMNFISAMPTNLYGPGDNFDLQNAHVLPAMVRKFHEAMVAGRGGRARPVVLWGSGKPRREFLHVYDLADACLFLMESYDTRLDVERGLSLVNVGVGDDISIRELGELIRGIVGYEGEVVWDAAKPDGTPKKLLDVSKINNLGWRASIGLRDGIKRTYEWYVAYDRRTAR
jgi:GDP-L-fucose synthase